MAWAVISFLMTAALVIDPINFRAEPVVPTASIVTSCFFNCFSKLLQMRFTAPIGSPSVHKYSDAKI
jgi:hypothetical protein